MIKKLINNFWPAIVITLVIFTFHIRLFFPHSSIYITPDYGRSDSWHFSIANKFYYAQELKKNRVPIWNPHIGMGFPTLAEGQTAIFFLPNLILFRVLPFVWAYNLTLVLSFITAGFGIYMFCRSLGLSKIAATYAGTIFPLGGFFVFHVQHHNLLQTASLMPWLFWTTNEFLVKKKVIFLLALSFILSQQIFAGFPQLTFYSLVALVTFFLLKIYSQKVKKIKLTLLLTFFILLGLALSSIQTFPTYELLKISNRENDPQKILTQFPYKSKNLLQFLDPFLLGSPKDASYPNWVPGKWGIYWESLAYVGIFPLALALSTIFLLFKKGVKNRYNALIFVSITVLSILLSLGKSSPLHPIYSIPLFSIFRVPSRFLLIAQFAIIMLASITLARFSRKKLVQFIIFLLSLANLFYVFLLYNPVWTSSQWFAETDSTKMIKNDVPRRILSIGNFEQWNNFLTSTGWNEKDYYDFARNNLGQNSNLIFNIDQLGAFESLPSKRNSLFYSIVMNGIKKDASEFKIASSSARLLSSANVSHLVSTLYINQNEFEKVGETEKYKDYSFKIYRNLYNHQKVFMTSKYTIARSIDELLGELSNSNFNSNSEIILESKPTETNLTLNNWEAKIVSESPNKVEIKTKTEGKGFLFLAESYYPGWEAFIDDSRTKIYPANITSQAIIIPEGDHQVIFRFKPKSLLYGITLTTISVFLLSIILLNYPFKKMSFK